MSPRLTPLVRSLLPASLVGLLTVLLQWALWPEADVAWLLSVSRRVLAGEILYSRDVVDPNLPLVIQLGAAVVQIGTWLRLDAVTAWRTFVALVSLGAFLLTWPPLSAALADRRAEVRSVMAVVLAAAVFAVPGVSFGQREHLVVVGFLPYLALAAARAASAPVSTPVAVVAGVALAAGLAIKPHYALAPALAELVVAGYRRSWRVVFRVETLVATGALLALVVQTIVWFPGYASFAVPLARRYYGEYGEATLLPIHGLYAATLAASMLVTSVLRGVTIQSRVFAAAALGAFAGFVIQGQGWVYHFLPAQTFALLAISPPLVSRSLQLLRRAAGTGPSPLWRQMTRALVAGAVVAVVAATGLRTTRANAGRRAVIVRDVLALVERAWPAGEPRTMAGLTLSLFPSFPVAELTGARWESRFSCLWLLPGIEAREREAGPGAPPDSGRQFLVDAVVDDLSTRRPTLVLTEVASPRALDAMLASAAFREVWAHYDRIGETENVAVYVRRSGPRE